MTLREEITGRKQFRGGVGGRGGSNNVKSILKKQHLQNLALWAGGEASTPSLGALFGYRLATCAESMGIPLDPSLFTCQRCESVLQPGYNCTVRIEKNKAKLQRRRKKSSIPTQNNVVYSCHFCSHRNMKRGTPRGHMKEIFALKPKPVSELKPICSTDQNSASSEKATASSLENNTKMEELFSSKLIPPISESESIGFEMHPTTSIEIPTENSPATPIERMRTVLSEGKRRKRGRSGANKQVETETISGTMGEQKAIGGSSKKRRKSWSSLKEIAENSELENSHNIINLTIPFII